MLEATVEMLKQRNSQSDREKVLEAQLFATREESKALHADIDSAVDSLRFEREKCLAMEDAVRGAEDRADAAEATVRDLQEQLRECHLLLGEARGLFVHGSHIDSVIDRKHAERAARNALSADVHESVCSGDSNGGDERPQTRGRAHFASSSGAGPSATARALDHARRNEATRSRTRIDAPAPAPAPHSTSASSGSSSLASAESRARAEARVAEYRARQARAGEVHSLWRSEAARNVEKAVHRHDSDRSPAEEASSGPVSRDRRSRYTPHHATTTPARSAVDPARPLPMSKPFCSVSRAADGAIGSRKAFTGTDGAASRSRSRPATASHRSASRPSASASASTSTSTADAPRPQTARRRERPPVRPSGPINTVTTTQTVPASASTDAAASCAASRRRLYSAGNGTTGSGWGVPGERASVQVHRPPFTVMAAAAPASGAGIEGPGMPVTPHRSRPAAGAEGASGNVNMAGDEGLMHRLIDEARQ
jgi:hypothetical protein